MVQGLDALIIALAPVFAAGFAVQKLIEILDAAFSAEAHWFAIGLEGIIGNVKEANKALTDANTTLNDVPNTEKDDIKEKKSDVGKAQKNVETANNDFEKSLKTLLTGIFSVIVALVIVSKVPNILVLTRIFNIDATTGAAAANTAIKIDPNIDKYITALFIATGTEGINSILKYLGYAKENKRNVHPQQVDQNHHNFSAEIRLCVGKLMQLIVNFCQNR